MCGSNNLTIIEWLALAAVFGLFMLALPFLAVGVAFIWIVDNAMQKRFGVRR